MIGIFTSHTAWTLSGDGTRYLQIFESGGGIQGSSKTRKSKMVGPTRLPIYAPDYYCFFPARFAIDRSQRRRNGLAVTFHLGVVGLSLFNRNKSLNASSSFLIECI